jgi:repressor LexA
MSMQCRHLDGDLVAVHRTPEVRNRQIVVARLENEVTVKRYRQDGSIAWLLPENEDFEPCVDLKQESDHRGHRGRRAAAGHAPIV